MNWQVNWTDDDGMIGNHRVHLAVAVHWDWTDLDWMELLGLTAIVPRDLADEATSEGDGQEDYWIPKGIFDLHLPLPLNCQGQMVLDHREVEEHPPVHLVSEVTDQHDPMAQLSEPGDEEVAASLGGQDAMEGGAKASREVLVRPGGEN